MQKTVHWGLIFGILAICLLGWSWFKSMWDQQATSSEQKPDDQQSEPTANGRAGQVERTPAPA